MRRAALAIVSTVAGLVMLLSFKTHSAVSTPPAAIGNANNNPGGSSGGTGTGTGSGTGNSGGAASSTAPGPSSSSAGNGGSSTANKTVTGDAVDTQYGPVQVQITVHNGKITKADAVVYPQNSSRDQEINSFAIPQLNQEVLSSQSLKIDSVSGATFTSDGYIGSLQSALNKAGL